MLQSSQASSESRRALVLATWVLRSVSMYYMKVISDYPDLKVIRLIFLNVSVRSITWP